MFKMPTPCCQICEWGLLKRKQCYICAKGTKLANFTTKKNQHKNGNDVQDSTYASSPFIYNPTGYVIAGDLKIINNTSLREVFAKGPKSINWKHNFKILMNSVENYARQWAKREKEGLDTLSEWVKSVRSLIRIRISSFVIVVGGVCRVFK
jgi:hypothetical protein